MINLFNRLTFSAVCSTISFNQLTFSAFRLYFFQPFNVSFNPFLDFAQPFNVFSYPFKRIAKPLTAVYSPFKTVDMYNPFILTVKR